MPSYQEILSLVWSARSESEAVDLVTRIAPDIPLPNRADFVEKMIGRAQEFINGLLAGKLLLALFPILPSDKREKLQLAASKQIERITDPGSLSRFRTLLAILTWVEPPAAALVIQVVPGSFASGRLRTIQAIIRQADPSGTRALATSLIHAAEHTPKDFGAVLLAAVVPFLPAEDRREIADRAAALLMCLQDGAQRNACVTEISSQASAYGQLLLRFSAWSYDPLGVGETVAWHLFDKIENLPVEKRRPFAHHLLSRLPSQENPSEWCEMMRFGSGLFSDEEFRKVVADSFGKHEFNKDWFREALRFLVQVPDKRAASVADPLIRNMLSGEPYRLDEELFLEKILPVLPGPARRTYLQLMLRTALAVLDRKGRVRALSRLLPLLPPELEPDVISNRVLSAINNIAEESERAKVLREAIPAVILHSRARLYAMINDFRKLEHQTFLRIEVYRAYPNLEGLADATFSLLQEIPELADRLRLLTEFMAASTQSQRERLHTLDLAFKVLTEIEEDVGRVRAYVSALKVIPEPELGIWRGHASTLYESLHADSSAREELMKVSEITLGFPRSSQHGLPTSRERTWDRDIAGIRVFDLASGKAQRGKPELSLAERAAKRRYVNTGFSALRTVMSSDDNARAEWRYTFWLEIGDLFSFSVERTPTEIPSFPDQTELRVAVYLVDDALRTVDGADVGKLTMEVDGSTRVSAQPIADAGRFQLERPETRLHFPLLIEAGGGIFRLRCNIYFRHVLIQSRIIRARVIPGHSQELTGLDSEVTYSVAPTLNVSALKNMSPHQLSIFLSDDTDSEVTFGFFARVRNQTDKEIGSEIGDGASDEIVKHQTSFDAFQLQEAISRARGALRRVAWGDNQDWDSSKQYRYAGRPGPAQFRDDVVNMAISGYRLYDMAVDRLAGDRQQARTLATTLRAHGTIQLALAGSPRNLVPVALFYDYPLDTGQPNSTYKVCPVFLECISTSRALEDCSCFTFGCAICSEGDGIIVCPSGFWGYRHSIGVPISGTNHPREIPNVIYRSGAARVTAVRSTDPAFMHWPNHERILRTYFDGQAWSCADSRSDALQKLRDSQSQIVYFYCHGGSRDGVPYLQVGSPEELVITRDSLRFANIDWDESRPLVFINGCKTAAVEPSQAIEFVSALIDSSASGVVGTEISLFEPLACEFAESFLHYFLRGDHVAEAIRRSRLMLLSKLNPLGLVYTTYALATLHLEDQVAAPISGER